MCIIICGDYDDVAYNFYKGIANSPLACGLLHSQFPALVWSKTFFCSLTNQRQLFGYSTFTQVALLMKILPTFRLPSSKRSIHNNDSHIVRFLRNSKLCCPNAKPQCYLLCVSARYREYNLFYFISDHKVHSNETISKRKQKNLHAQNRYRNI